MESPPQELNEEKLDAAIADMLREDACQQPNVASMKRPEFPDLVPQEEVRTGAKTEATGFSANLRQKWAELSGAA